MYFVTAATFDSLTLNTPYPSELWTPVRPNPFGRVRFDHASDLRGGLGRPDAYQHMNVIGGAVSDQRRSLHLADDASQVGKQMVAERWLDQRASSSGC